MRKSDTVLLERWIAVRDPEAFSELVDRHAGMVVATCRRVLGNLADAEETAQDCFLQLSQAKQATVTSLGGWLHHVATNRALDRLRSERRRTVREQKYAAEQPASDVPAWDDIQHHVDEIVAALPDDLQAPLVLHFFEGRTHREVARALGCSRSTVTGRIQKAIGEIREALDARGIAVGLAALAGLFAAYETHAARPTVMASLNKIGLAAGRPVAAAGLLSGSRIAIAAVALVLMAGTAWVAGNSVGTPQPEPTRYAEADPPAGAPSLEEAPPPAEVPVALAAPVADVPAASPPDVEMIRLRCVDEEENPVEGAEVYYVRLEHTGSPMIQSNHPDDTRRVPFGPVLSDADGYVEVPTPDVGAGEFSRFYSAYARVPDKLVGAWMHSARSMKDAGWDTIVMVQSTRVGGVVTVPAGFDPAKVTVNVLSLRIKAGGTPFGASFSASSKYVPPLWPELFSTSPERDGTFSLGDIPAGHAYYLEFTAPGLGEAQRYNFTANGDERLAVEMLPEATISGTVRYANGGPVVDAPVFARPNGGPNSGIGVTTSFQGRTDTLGRYAIKGLPAEVYTVLVQHYGNPPEWVSAVVPMLEAQPGMKYEAVDFIVERGALQEGTLLDKETGQPIPEAWLVAMNPGDGENIYPAEAIGVSETDAAGKFTFRLPTGVSYLYFFMAPEEYVPPKDQGRTFITVAPGESVLPPLTFHLAKKSEEEMAPIGKAKIEGRVVDAEGQVLAGVPIAIGHKYKHGENDRQEQIPSRPTDKDGRFSVTVLATGEHQLIVGGGEFSRVSQDWYAVEADETKSFGDIMVEHYDQRIVVILKNFNVDSTVAPPDVLVRARDSEEHLADGMVDANGRIEFSVPNTPLTVSGGQDGFKYFEVDVDPGTETELELEPEE